MRIGFNPNKDKELLKTDFFHQVIIPVYIPNEEGYFKDSFQILKYCLESLFKTSHVNTYFTVVNNGSCKEVVAYLNVLHQNGIIHEIIHTSAIGKLNAILKGLIGQNFHLVTITDADVLFLNNWQSSTYEVFQNFSKAGAVCTTPSSKSFNNKTFNILFEKLFSKELRFTPVKNAKALESFAVSIDNLKFYNKAHLKHYLTISNGNFRAVVGAGHFVTTYRFDVFDKIKIAYTNYNLGGNSESELLDVPVIKKGFWRLSTEDNYTFHMGNAFEPWMDEVFTKIERANSNEKYKFNFKPIKQSKFVYWLKNILFERILYHKKIKHRFLQYKGLTKEEAVNY